MVICGVAHLLKRLLDPETARGWSPRLLLISQIRVSLMVVSIAARLSVQDFNLLFQLPDSTTPMAFLGLDCPLTLLRTHSRVHLSCSPSAWPSKTVWVTSSSKFLSPQSCISIRLLAGGSDQVLF